MSEIEQKCTVLLSILIFQFCFFFSFFWIPITFRNFLVTLSSQFFDFLSYMAGKCIFVSQMPTNSEKNPKNVHFYCRYLFFNFAFFSVFFGFQLPLETFWLPYRAIFLIFCPIWQENSLFCVKYSPFLLKLRKSLPKVCFVGENPGHFTKNSSIS